MGSEKNERTLEINRKRGKINRMGYKYYERERVGKRKRGKEKERVKERV